MSVFFDISLQQVHDERTQIGQLISMPQNLQPYLEGAAVPHDSDSFGQTRSTLSSQELAALAQRAIAALAQDRGSPAPLNLSRAVSDLSESAIQSDGAIFAEEIANLRRSGLTSQQLVQSVIPDTARLLGEHWIDDKLTFSEVTIGARRLQSAVYEAMRISPVAAPNLKLQAQAAMIIPIGEQHMIGASVASHAFEQRGVRMRLIVGLEEEALARMLRLSGFAFAGFSVSSNKSVDLTLSLVEKLRSTYDLEIPLVIGGSAVAAVHQSPGIVAKSLVSSDPDAILDATGIRALKAPGK